MNEFSMDVLQGYFDDLLTPAPQVPEPAPQPVEAALPVAEPRVVETSGVDELARQKLARLLASRPLQVAAAAPAPVQPRSPEAAENSAVPPALGAEPAVAELPVSAPVREAAVVAEVAASAVEDQVADASFGWLENGRPAWAQERFEVLLFEVAGLTLAVPLVCLGQIQPLTGELTPLFGQADWFMGLHSTPLGQVRTINTARFVMPERYQDHFVKAARYVISIAGSPWGLAVDAVNQPIALHPDDVRWRGERSKRPWLAGTVKQHMCALLDVETMGQLLRQAEQTSTRTDPLKA